MPWFNKKIIEREEGGRGKKFAASGLSFFLFISHILYL
jgi:hypothetical protein